MKIALLGAESSGKTQLAMELASRLTSLGQSVVVIPEVLREWCEHEGRTPSPVDQYPIAREQARRVITAETSDFIITDTAPLVTAVYSEWLFSDHSIYDFAFQHHAIYDVTLLMGLDLPWVADTHLRDGPHSQEPVDALIRTALELIAVPYSTVYGRGSDRCHNALAILMALRSGLPTNSPIQTPATPSTATGWAWHCDQCDDAVCEHRLFQNLLGTRLIEVKDCLASDDLGQ